MPTHFLNFAHLPLHSRHVFFTRVNKINFHFFRLHGYVLRFVMYSEVGYELVLGMTWFWYELVVGTSWSGYELVLDTSWLGYELAWYDLVRVRVDWKPRKQENPKRDDVKFYTL